jgi:hypothetical protein
MTTVDIAPQVRAGFVLRGTSLRAWCRANDIDPGYAHKVLAGKTQGPKALKLRAKLFEASQGGGA